MDIDGVKKALQVYFDSCYESDAEGGDKVFHDVAHLYLHAEDGSLLDWDKNYFLDLVRKTPSGSGEQGFPRYDEIISIDFTGEKTAVAQVKVRVVDTLYTDILCFMLLDGKWQIIAKVFTGVPAE